MNFLGTSKDGTNTPHPTLKKFIYTLPSFQTIGRICYSLTQALEFMHTQGFLHNDLHTSNIIIKNNDSGVIIDFGKATPICKGKPYNIKDPIIRETYNKKHSYLAHKLQYSYTPTTINKATDVYSLGYDFYLLASYNGSNDAVRQLSKRITNTDHKKRFIIKDALIN